MSGDLKIALALWIAEQLPGLHVFGTRAANQQGHYPECLVTFLNEDSQILGLPRNTDKTYEDGKVTEKGKLFKEESYFRLTFGAPDDTAAGLAGLTRVDALRSQLKEIIQVLQLQPGSLTLTDSEADPAVEFPIKTIEISGQQNVPPKTNQEPFIYHCALSVRLVRHVRRTRLVDHTIETIHTEEVPYEEG